MIGTLNAFAFDCPDPLELAKFYQGIVGGTINPEQDGEDAWVELITDPGGPHLAFQRSPGYVAPVWPGDDGDQQAHLDISVDDLDTAHEQLLELGARSMKEYPTFRVYLDPVGHPFCTVAGD